MQESFVIDAKELAGRRIVIDLPEDPKRSYIACNPSDWSVKVDASVIKMENEFLWNYEQGRKVIYSSNTAKVGSSENTDIDLRVPLWSLSPQNIMLNDKPIGPTDTIIHDFDMKSDKVVFNNITAEGKLSFPSVVFSSKVDNGFGLYVELYADIYGSPVTLWSKTIKLSNINDYKRAKYKNKEYYVWDTVFDEDFNFNMPLNTIMDNKDMFGLGIAVKMVSTSEVFIGQKEEMDASIFRFSNFHYILQFSDA